jgi:SAM-dependent methyltransferase
MTTAAYDALAPYYRQYAKRRAAYCDSVDRTILGWRHERGGTMLDVGSGDGVRALHLARALGVTSLVLSDPSRPMSAQCRAVHDGAVLTCAAEALPDAAGTFDLITCLWNVLGAIEQPEGHLTALLTMRERLSPSGRLFLDVHNRYNMATVGAPRVVARRVRDALLPRKANGLVSFTWEIGDLRVPTRGYLFAEREILGLFVRAGLRPVQRTFVHYDTGAICGRWSGQMVFALAAD